MSVKQVFNTSAELDYPTVLPTLDLDFANSKTLDPRITFTRASGGSYVGADGLIKYAGVNEPRFDHDPVTGESLGFLVEQSRTNSLFQSSDLTAAGWALAGFARTANSTTAPDGTNTAVKIASTTGTFGFLERNNVSSPAGVVTYSWYAKAAEANWFAIGDIEFGLLSAYFNLATGTLGTRSAGTAHTITPVGNGWYRCSVTGTNTSLSSRWGCFASLSDNTLTPAPIGNGVHVWGPQLEAFEFPTSYIPTEASTRTRAADFASITGKNFSSWYRQDEGTIITKIIPALRSNLSVWTLSDGTTVERMLGYSDSAFNFYVTDNSSTQVNIGGFPFTVNAVNTSAAAYKLNNFNYSRNGSIATVDTSGSVPTPNRLQIMAALDASGVHTGTISRLTYYPVRLPDAQLQVLTT